MDNGADIVVASSTGRRTLVVEVKTHGDIERASLQLTKYMRSVGAELGLVVMRESIRILRDTYRDEPSVITVGEYPTTLADGLGASEDPLEFENSVQRWVEALSHGEQVAHGPLLAALLQHIVPAISDGTVRAAHPRQHRVAG